MTVKIFSAFSGYGGFEFVFKKSNISHRIVGHSEIDKYANKIYDLNHPNIKNYGDITKINPEIAHTLTAGANSTGLHSDMDIFSIDNCKFRRLTPRECFRLMGFLNDEIKFGSLSNAQLYKLAGNGCEVNLLSQIVGGFKWN